jgi:hypothetical protein
MKQAQGLESIWGFPCFGKMRTRRVGSPGGEERIRITRREEDAEKWKKLLARARR